MSAANPGSSASPDRLIGIATENTENTEGKNRKIDWHVPIPYLIFPSVFSVFSVAKRRFKGRHNT